MKLGHFLMLVAAFSVGGLALGWVLLPILQTADPLGCPSTSTPLAAHRHFDLTPDDLKLDKEKPALVVDAAGRALLAWTSQTGSDEYTLFLSRSDDQCTNFGTPTAFRKVPIHRYSAQMKGKSHTMVTPLLPRLAVLGNTMTLSWLEPQESGRTQLVVARSTDGGRTFAEPACVHGSEAGRPNFTTLVAGLDGRVVSVWLDNRNKSQQPFCSVLGADGKLAGEALVHAEPDGKGVCPCCDLDAAVAEDGTVFTAFRNSRDGRRDVYVSRSKANEGLTFDAPVPVTGDPWTFDGCPHDGPSLALSQGRLHVLWMDAHTGKRQVFLATSGLDKLDFKPRRLGPVVEEEQGHPHLAATDSGKLFAVWEQALPGSPPADPSKHEHGAAPTGTGRAVMFACSQDHGDTFAVPVALNPIAGVFQLHPTVAAGADGTVLVAWNEVSESGKKVVVARLSPSIANADAAACCADGCCDVPARGALLNGR